jgi:hypothetical protein
MHIEMPDNVFFDHVSHDKRPAVNKPVGKPSARRHPGHISVFGHKPELSKSGITIRPGENDE